MAQIFADEINNDKSPDRALKLLRNPTTAKQIYGITAEPDQSTSVIVPDNDILGSVLARRVRRMKQSDGENINLTQNFALAPTARRFSIVAYQRDSIFNVAGFATVSWSLDSDHEMEGIELNDEIEEITLSIYLEALFIDNDYRDMGYAVALQDTIIFWAHSLVLDLDRKASKRNKPFNLSIILLGDASSSFSIKVIERYATQMQKGFQTLSQKTSLTCFKDIEFQVDITWPEGHTG